MPKRVLIIDDDPATRLLLRQILEPEGYEIQELESAARLEGAIEEFAPDLILSDLIMPGRDGLAVLKTLRSDPRTRSIPVVLVSAKNFDGDQRSALNAGAAGYVVKPFTKSEILTVAVNALATRITVTICGCRGSIATPEWAHGRYGGNTACVDIALPGHRHIIFDAGTGIRPLGNRIASESPMQIALLLSHFHWDHIQGLPFFKPLFISSNLIQIHGPADSSDDLIEIIRGGMGGELFPVSTESFRSSLKFVPLQEQSFDVLGVPVSALYAFHPGRTLAYRVELDGHSIVYAPDSEIVPETVEPELSGEALRLARFAAGASVLIHDATYSSAAYEERGGWGHSCGPCVAAVAAQANVGKVLLFHHDPDNSDEEIEEIHREFQEALAALGSTIPSEPAREGACFSW